MPAKVAVRDLSKAYGGISAVSGVSFEIGEGEIFGLLGPNGAGKTTTIETLIGLVEPDSGEVRICGIDATSDRRRAKQKIGVALQSTGLQEKITPAEALRLFGSFYRSPVAPELLLERFGLLGKADARFDTLSGGQRQRLALALAFVNDPEAVFLDEPTVGLDPQMRLELHQQIREMKREGRSILLTTHDMEEAEQLCDRIAVINKGRIVAEGTPRELIAGSRSALTVSFQASSPLNPDWAEHLPHVSEAVADAGRVRFTTTDLTRALGELATYLEGHNIQITALKAARATLEDVIIELTGPGVNE
jgi:ABC-2 type transport system ATP-binding protein